MKVDLALSLRLSFYLLISVIYLLYISHASPLGIEPLPFQEERTLNAIRNFIENPELARIGVSSWTEPGNKTSKYYFVQIITYLHYIPSYMVGGEELLKKVMRFTDPAVVVAGWILCAELFVCLTGKNLDEISRFVCGIICFTLGVTSIYSYRMMLSSWHDVYCFGLVILAALLFSKSNNNTGFICLTLGFMCQYHWGLFFLIYVLISYAYILIFPLSSGRFYYLPPAIRSLREKILLVSCPAISILLVIFQKVRLGQLGFESSNSSLSYRIGIDSIHNIHHGGLVGSLQFLGGIRITECLKSDFLSSLSKASGVTSDALLPEIFKFNCLLVWSSSAILGVIAIAGFIIMSSEIKTLRWFSFPVLFSMVATYSILQQSTSAHLQGRSFLFTVLLSYGITYLLMLLKKKKHWCPAVLWRASFSLIASAGVVINSIRLSLLLGVNG